MNGVFVDTLFWVASIYPNDPWYGLADRAALLLGPNVPFVTTDEILTEVLSSYSKRGEYLRRIATSTIRSLYSNRRVTVMPQSRESFFAGFELYEQRSDKGYSLVDCISMQTMREHGIGAILTNDHHFEQEGFEVLIKR